jgi:ABC-2 type transport system permease protein
MSAIAILVAYDVFFLALLFALVAFLATTRRAAYAVLKRNFFGYFSNPTGYVFLCLFVLLTSMAAFWPHAFFKDNIGSLTQLNNWFVYIMLFFIPAITMSIWAEERRQGTDELLLTLPADDFDIVIGKYSAAVAIFTTSLLFSQLSNFVVLWSLTIGDIDVGLFFANYLGYWFIGIAMISIGMVASFLTNNLTVGFILGALFNSPLAFAQYSDTIFPSDYVARVLKGFSAVDQFDNFGRGVLSASSIVFFTLVAVFGLYLCMVMVGKRHWSGGEEGNKMFLHYLVRTLLIAVIVIAASAWLKNKDRRIDATEGKVSSLSETTTQLVRSLKPERPIVVDAFLSADVPEQYAKVKYEVLALLKEFEATAKRANVPVEVHLNSNIETSSEEEQLAKEQFNIEPRVIQVRERGVLADRPILLGAAFRSGLDKVVVPFFEPGVPVEYQLIQAMNTVSRPTRKKLGVLRTDAQINGGFSQSTFQPIPRQQVLDDLEKQYDIVDVDASSPIDVNGYDCLLAVQPSSLSPEQMPNFVAAVQAGLPTAIFEDALPFAFNMPGTGEPKQAGGNPMMGQQPPQPKGDIRELWKALDIEVPGKPSFQTGGINPDMVWQQYNPYPIFARLKQANNFWLFVPDNMQDELDLISDKSLITEGINEIMFLYASSIKQAKEATLKFTPLVTTFSNSGLMPYDDANIRMMEMEEIRRKQGPATGGQIIAALIEGEAPATQAKDATTPAPTNKPIKAVYVSDADFMSDIFVNIRNQPDMYSEVNFRMQNITFFLNIVDVLANELDYPKVRGHVPQYATLRLVEQQSELARSEEAEQARKFSDIYNEAVQTAEAEDTKEGQEFKKQLEEMQAAGIDTPEEQRRFKGLVQKYQMNEAFRARSLAVTKQTLQRELDEKTARVSVATDRKIRDIQNWYKMWAVCLPAIPPLLVGVVVFVSRRLREREGISKARLK